MRRIPVLLLAVAAIVGLAGCTATAPPQSHRAHTAVTPRPVPDGVVGTGTLTSWNGKTTGTLTVVAKSGHFTFVLNNFATDVTIPDLFVLADNPVTMSQCGERNLWQLGMTTLDGNVTKPTMTFGLPNVVDALGDPSFFQYFLLLEQPTSPERGCQQPITALTRIRWTMKPVYPQLAVHDSGKAASAEGTVKLVNGKPFSYVTAVGDTWSSIAARFGLTPAELLYLNPIRHPEGSPAIAYNDQVLNLSPTNRGNSESRRPGAQ